MIRVAKESDVQAMLSIYTPYVENTAITFDLVVPSLAEFTQKIAKIQAYAPCLVYEHEGEVVGYAYADVYRKKAAYKWTRELTVYVRKDVQTRKYGTALYYSLIELLKCQNYRNALAAITLPNIPSVNFHERFGFHQVGVFEHVGYKQGKSYRVGWWQLGLTDTQGPAEEIIPLEKVLATEEGQRALKKGEARILT